MDHLPDAPAGNWIDRSFPPALRPFARLARWDRPIGWWLLLLPCWWSATLAAVALDRTYPSIANLALFLIGAIVMRGAGCTYNDIVDRDLDASVARTSGRPIPSGQVTVATATVFLVAQATIGLAILFAFNSITLLIALASLPFVVVYPYLKRITNWPQLGLGLAFSWGALLGWASEAGSISAAPLILYAGGVLWTIGYDTIYALQDLEDDALIGVRSTARLFGKRVVHGVAALYVGAIVLFGIAYSLAGVGWLAYAGLAMAAAQLGWQTGSVGAATTDPGRALRLFRSNRTFGLILLVGLLVDAAATAG